MPVTATDPAPYFRTGPDGPYEHAAAVTPSDTDELTTVASALYVGTAGALKIVTAGGDAVTFGNVAAGVVPVRTKKVFSTGTVASNITALW